MRVDSVDLDRRTWRNWLLMLGTSVVATAGLGVGVSPLLRSQPSSMWPWSYTELVLLLGLALTVATLGSYLTLQQRSVAALRRELLRLHENDLARAEEHAAVVESANQELNREIRAREAIAGELRSLNETLEIRVAERSAAAERHADELRRAKESLEERNQRLLELYKAAHRFVDNVSHEFRTPLTVIKEYASAAREELPPEALGTRECLDTVLHRVDELTVMVNDILDLSRIEADILRTSRRTCCVPEVVARVRDMLERKAAAAGVTLEIEIGNQIPAVYCDPEKIGRVIVNLVVNAVKFSPGGSVVRLWARHEPGATTVVIGVTDQGPGIAPENREAIFERFKQFHSSLRTSTNGFGLGLNIAKELVQLNFGALRVDSQLGAGSTFEFTLPVALPAAFLACYLAHVRRLPRSAVCVLLLRVAPEGPVDGTLDEDVEYFLENQMRRTDLVVRSGRRAWHVLVAVHDADPRPLIDRLEEARRECNRGRPDMPLPELRWALLGSWSLDGPCDELARALPLEDVSGESASPAEAALLSAGIDASLHRA